VTLSASTARLESAPRFRHEAILYDGLGGLVGALLPFITEGLRRGEPVLAALPADRVRLLEDALGADAAGVSFLDMAEVGRNPARIIAEWRRFVEEHRDRPAVRGIGEPVWDGRRAEELEECRFHEALLNLAFDNGPAWQLVCPYDAAALSSKVLDDVELTHPHVRWGEEAADDDRYRGHDFAFSSFAQPLPPPAGATDEIAFGALDLAGVRAIVRRVCQASGLGPDGTDALVLAVHELATNSIEHGGGRGLLRVWTDPRALVFEIADHGVIHNPLVGRIPSVALAEGGRGVWLANQLCDLVQVRSSGDGTVVRVFTWR
jgi:anti-sigma regulatory factor (Ser/Thr protein kinase)